MYKNFNAYITKLLERAKISNPRRMLKKLLQDIDNHEKFYGDKEYRNKLESSARCPSSEYFELENIYEQEKKIKEKLNLPPNRTIRYEKVKCSKNCRHNTHLYYYVRKRHIEHYDKTDLYLIMCACITSMCEFIGYETKNKMKNKIVEDWQAEPELENVQEEQQQQPIPVTQ